MTAHGYLGAALRCPVCGRPLSGLELRSGDAWLSCWGKGCRASAWACRVAGAVPTPADVVHALGPRLAQALLAAGPPAPLAVLAVPEATRKRLAGVGHVSVVVTVTAELVGSSGPIGALVGPPDQPPVRRAA